MMNNIRKFGMIGVEIHTEDYFSQDSDLWIENKMLPNVFKLSKYNADKRTNNDLEMIPKR